MANIDIVIPCYNGARFLPRSVESVCSQDFQDLRVIIIDNASTDGSVDIAQRLAQEDNRIEVVCHEVNVGPHKSFNEGIDIATADYFMILCADDLLVPGVLKPSIALLEEHPEAVCLIGTEGESIVGDEEPKFVEQPSGWHITDGYRFIERCCRTFVQDLPAYAILSRTSVQKKVGYYRASLTHLDDVELLLRLACNGPVVETQAPLVIKRLHENNLSEGMWQDRKFDLQEREKAFDSFFTREGAAIPGASRLHGIAKRRIGEAGYWSAISHFFRGRTGEGAELLRYAFVLNPVSKLVPPLGYLCRKRGALKRASTVLANRLLPFARSLEGSS